MWVLLEVVTDDTVGVTDVAGVLLPIERRATVPAFVDDRLGGQPVSQPLDEEAHLDPRYDDASSWGGA
jgi:hypothetical protein